MSSLVAATTTPTTATTAAEAKAAKKREQSRKKKARQKAKKLAAATAAAQKNEEEKKTDATTTKPMYINKTTRKEAGKGRGKGMFAKVAIAAGEVIVRSRPALSTVFDPFAQSICSFCFKPASAAGTVKVDLHLNKRDGKVGIFFDEKKIRGAIRCVINGVAKGGVEASPNALSGVMPGDVVETIAGHQLAAGKGALSRCLELLKSAGAAAATKECMFPITVRRVALQPCLTCSRAAICMDCDRAGCGAWHSLYECPAFVQLPEAVKKGESSPIRMMLRYKSIATAGEWTGVIDGGDGGSKKKAGGEGGEGCKEPLAMVHTLQANTDVVPTKQREALSKMTGVPPTVVKFFISFLILCCVVVCFLIFSTKHMKGLTSK